MSCVDGEGYEIFYNEFQKLSSSLVNQFSEFVVFPWLLTVCDRIQPLHGRHIFWTIEMGGVRYEIFYPETCFRRSIFVITEFVVYPYTQEMSFRCHDDSHAIRST